MKYDHFFDDDKGQKRLSVGDQLYSESSWEISVVTIITVSHIEAVSDNGLRFYRNFIDGDKYLNTDQLFTLDFLYWFLKV